MNGTSARHDDLLQPTLGTLDDMTGFERPWNPWNLVFVSFFAGSVGGGALLSLNFGRLGLKSRAVTCMLAFVLLQVGLAVTVAVLIDSGTIDWADGLTRQWVRRGTQGLTVLPAMGVASMQRRRFQLFERSGGETGRLWTWVVGALALGWLASIGALFAAFTALDVDIPRS